jgi:60 kDa SS-A/Ro ribonucleoprotein
MGYLKKNVGPKHIPQSEPLDDRQVPNNAGGFVYKLDPWKQLDRFLITGTEGGTYYVKERKLTKENLDGVKACLKEDGVRVVDRAVEISDAGRALKNDTALLIMALASLSEDPATKNAAYANMHRVARTGMHLFTFADLRKELEGGWGRGMKNAISNWFTKKNADKVAFQTAKYQQREGWSMRDLLRLAHPIAPTPEHQAVFHWITKGEFTQETIPRIIYGMELAKKAEDVKEIVKLVEEYKLPREMIPTEYLNKPEVQEVMLPNMPPTALIRNLGNLTRSGLVKPLSAASKLVIAKLEDKEYIKQGRVHPISVLVALNTYKTGHGFKGKGEWVPVPAVIDALDTAFYAAFGNIEPCGKNMLLAFDVSGSMGSNVNGVENLSCRTASAVMAMATIRSEKTENVHSVMFSSGSGRNSGWGRQHAVSPFDISAKQRLDTVVRNMDRADFGGTDCSLPMLYATKNKLDVEAFVVYTDSETWAGEVHPMQALKEYRKKFNPKARLVVVGMASNGFSIADPNDVGTMDIVGFDTAAPQVISQFVSGNLSS